MARNDVRDAERTVKWDTRFLELAATVATWSRDPSTKVGAVIARPDNTICSVGFNGFPKGMDDDPALYENRSVKYDRTVHAEVNAILNASEPVYGYSLYTWPFATCSRCSILVIQSGIRRVCFPSIPYNLKERWAEDIKKSMEFYKEANVEVWEY